MKKLSLTVKTLAAGVIAICMAACASNDKAATPAEQTTTDVEATTATTNIRYINADSVMLGYTLAREITEEGQRLMNNYQQQAQAKQNEIQSLGAEIQRKQQNNIYLSEASFNNDVNNFNKKQEEAARYLQGQEAKIQTTIAQAQQRLNDSIQNFARDFAIANGFDAVLLLESGVYFNPALNVTNDFVEGLNARYAANSK